MDRKKLGNEKNSDVALCETNQQRESENSRLFGELRTIDGQEIGELRTICCKEVGRVRQLRIDELSTQKKENPFTVNQFWSR